MPASTIQQAEQAALKLGVKSVDYQQHLAIANDVNAIMVRLAEMGISPPDRIQINPTPFRQWAQQYGIHADDMPAAFSFYQRTGESCLFINPASPYWLDKKAYVSRQGPDYWSTDAPDHAIWHELGHLMHYQNSPAAYKHPVSFAEADLAIVGTVSQYALDGVREFVAETFAALVSGRTLPNNVLNLYQMLGGLLP